MAYVICEKWFNGQLLEEILKIRPQSLGQLLPPQILTDPQKCKYNGRIKRIKKESLLFSSS